MKTSRGELIHEMVFNALLAAIYVVLTVVISPLSYGAIQFRFSEFLVLFCFWNKRYTIGLALGCLIANIFSPMAALDIPFGTLATLLACCCIMYSKWLLLALTFPVVFNAFIVAGELAIIGEPYWMSVLTVGAGEAAVMAGSYIVLLAMKKSKTFYKVIRATQNLEYKF